MSTSWRSLVLTTPPRGPWREVELRGDKPGHKFHGNQFPGGGGESDAPATVGSGNVVASGPKGRTALVASLREHGYTGPVSYSVGKLQMLHDQHVGSAVVQTKIGTSFVHVHKEIDSKTSAHVGESAMQGAARNLETSTHPGAVALKRYTDSGVGTHQEDDEESFYKVNTSMREGKPNADARAMLTLAHDHPPGIMGKSITVDRGVSGAHATELRGLRSGATVEYKSFVSTTHRQFDPTKEFGTPATGFSGTHTKDQPTQHTFLRITIPPSTRFLPGNKDEGEMILLPGKLRVTHVSTGTWSRKAPAIFKNVKTLESPYTIIHAEYVG